MAHFIEHMLFKGTESRSSFDIANELEAVGGSINAYTSRCMTCYYAVVLDENIDIAIDVLSDMLTNSVIDKEEIIREQSVVVEEIHSSEDIPEELVQDVFADSVLNPLPESKAILGTEKCVMSITREEILSYIDDHYTPENIVISAAGNIDHKILVEKLTKVFSAKRAKKQINIPNVQEKNIKHQIIEKDISQAHICCGSKIFGFNDSRRMSLWIMSTILGGGMSSRLFQNIREKAGLAYSVYAFSELFQSDGLMATYAATDAINAENTLSLIMKEYSLLKTEMVEESTLNDAKSQLIGGLLLSQDSSISRMNRLGKQEMFYQNYSDTADTILRIKAVSSKDIIELSQDIFNSDKLITVTVTTSK